MKFSNSV